MAQEKIPVLYNPISAIHNPPFEVFNGREDTASEIPARYYQILDAVNKSGIADVSEDTSVFLADIATVHSPEYLEYLNNSKSLNSEDSIFPSVHPYADYGHSTSPVADRGRFCFDTYTPVMSTTADVAIASASLAISGAKLLEAGENVVYTLNRPPGHHATRTQMGGYCYLNNVAIAANFLARGGSKVAVLDIDLHHGNGTQDIFYSRNDVFVANIHADPSIKFPHFTGYSEEIGRGVGLGFNKNYPLPAGTTDKDYSPVVNDALEKIAKFSPKYLLVSAGFDTHEEDPIGAFKLTTSFYGEIGRRIKSLNLPVLAVQEGGYATKILGDNVVSFLDGLK